MQRTQLDNIFSNVNGASFVGIDTLTDVKLAGGKSNPLQGKVKKLMIGASVMVFQNKNGSAYEAMIQRRLAKEGKDPASFELSPRAWGERIPNMPIVEHTKDGQVKHYLEVIFLKSGKVEYLVDNVPTAKEDIPGLAESNAGEQGGLDNKVIIRTFAAESILAVRVDGEVFA